MQSNLYFFCGKMGAGKSTYAKRLASEKSAVLLSEDEWLSALYPDKINTFEDYIYYSSLMRPIVQDLVTNILHSGSSVVMDFPGNTKKQRQWFVDIATKVKAHHQLIYLDIDDKTCIQRLSQRLNEQPGRAKFDNEHMFHVVSQYFEEPNNQEMLDIQRIDVKGQNQV